MRLPEVVRTSTFRLALAFASAFAALTLLLFAFIYWETAVFETRRIDALLTQQAEVVAGQSTVEILRAVDTKLAADLHRITYAALFAANGRLVAGNLEHFPSSLPPDGQAHQAEVVRLDDGVPTIETVRAVARRLADGRLLVIGRNIDELEELRHVVVRALELGVIPAVTLSLLAGALLSWRAQQRVKAVHRTAERIMQGDFRERLPTRGTGDDFDRLADSVNRMLDEIERLLDEIKGVGDNIAHDLRTPLTRLRTRLERARHAARSREELQETVDRAIADLDQTLAVITALLRIAEIEDGRRRAAFAAVDLAALVREVADLYEPIAEEKQIRLDLDVAAAPSVHGDRDLLMEAVANLVDNAIKFTPEGGRVRLSLAAIAAGAAVRVADTGPGIRAEERNAVLKRFYRSDKSRHINGSGLGLSLVAAIAKLHDFSIVIGGDASGCVCDLVCRAAPAAGEPRSLAIPAPLPEPVAEIS